MFLNYQCQLSPLKWHDTNNKISSFLNFGHYSYSWNWTNNPDSFSTILVMLSCIFHFGIVFTLHVKWDPDFNTRNHINKLLQEWLNDLSLMNKGKFSEISKFQNKSYVNDKIILPNEKSFVSVQNERYPNIESFKFFANYLKF